MSTGEQLDMFGIWGSSGLQLEPPMLPYAPPEDVNDAFGDEALARRAKAMACTVPLHDLEANKGRVRDGAFAVYTVWGLAFVAIDTVTVQMDFDRGAVEENVIVAMLPYARRQAPDRAVAEHQDVCKWVLDQLIGTTSNRGFAVDYGDWNGEYVRRSFGFQLLTEHQAQDDGSVYLRATDEAINVLVGALDTDVESAQAATEAKLDNLIRRGKLSEAQYAARQALWRTAQFGERIRQDIAATKRNLLTVNWAQDVSPQLDGALIHIGDRLEFERRLMNNISEMLHQTEQDTKRLQAANLIEQLEGCQRLHMELQARLMSARTVFLEEQERQVFAPPASVRLRDVSAEMLVPALRASLADAEPAVVPFFERVVGPVAPRLIRLSTLVSRLLTPPVERDELGAHVQEPELHELIPFEAFPEDVRVAAQRVLDTVSVEPRRLSELIDLGTGTSPAVGHLIALLGLHAFSPAVQSRLQAGDDSPVLVAWSDGRSLPAMSSTGVPFPFHGDDLLVMKLGLVFSELEREVA